MPAEIEYATAWRRLGAFFLDGFILAPFGVFGFLVAEVSRTAYVAQAVLTVAVGFLFHVVLVARYGATPGKLLLGIRLRKLESDTMDFQAALNRYSVTFVLAVLTTVLTVKGLFEITDEAYDALTAGSKAFHVSKTYSTGTLSYLLGAWVWSEFIVMLLNKRRRAIHDFIAGTIVIRDNRFPKHFLVAPSFWIALALVVGISSQVFTVYFMKSAIQQDVQKRTKEELENRKPGPPDPTATPEPSVEKQ